ncbi:MAG: hypothetical protein R3267_01235 [Paenisporosarcina sp.]|nr:hypothetical protein [Paenisporosarcina sp.]
MKQKQYYLLTLISTALMATGLFVAIPRYDGLEVGLLIHLLLIILLSSSLVIYPKYERYLFRIIIIIIGAAYFYMLFFYILKHGRHLSFSALSLVFLFCFSIQSCFISR